MHEFNIFRLRPSGQDVVAFQFAFRLYGSGRLSDNELESRRQRWMEMVKGAAIPKLADKIP